MSIETERLPDRVVAPFFLHIAGSYYVKYLYLQVVIQTIKS